MGILGIQSASATKVMLCLSVVMLASCRLVIETDEKGAVVSRSGLFNCELPECAWNIDQEYSDTLTAIPANGYRFVRWNGFCSRFPTDKCQIELGPTPQEHMQYDGDISISAEFESSTKVRDWYRDADGDDYGDPTNSVTSGDQLPGFVINNKDCDDTNVQIAPGKPEKVDAIDNNCNGKIDEGFNARTWYRDHDRDGWGNPKVTQISERQPLEFVATNLDCDDNDNQINPEAQEIRDGIDNNCDGLVDETGLLFYPDIDGDGFGRKLGVIGAKVQPEGYTDNRDDCDDEDPQVNPNAEEVLDSVDNDCDGRVDENLVPERFYLDQDGDTYGDPADWMEALVQPEGYADNAGDNCPDDYNPFQKDKDGDGLGDACDDFTDSDGDDIQDSEDNCPLTWNPEQQDSDDNGIGDQCQEEEGEDEENEICTVISTRELVCVSTAK